MTKQRTSNFSFIVQVSLLICSRNSVVDGHGIVNDYFKLQKVDPPGEGGEEG